MTAADQLYMFEPEGFSLAELVSGYIRNGDYAEKRSELLQLLGFNSASVISLKTATECYEKACIAEMALQFEQLAGLL